MGLDRWVCSQLCREVGCVCMCPNILVHHGMSNFYIDVILIASVCQTDCQAQIMVIIIMVIYCLFCAWQCARCITSFNPSNIPWVDIYNLYYNNLREVK